MTEHEPPRWGDEAAIAAAKARRREALDIERRRLAKLAEEAITVRRAALPTAMVFSISDAAYALAGDSHAQNDVADLLAASIQDGALRKLTGSGGDTKVRRADLRQWCLVEGLSWPFSDPAPPAANGASVELIDAEKPLGTRERNTLLVIIGALATEAKINCSDPYKAGAQIEAALSSVGVSVSSQTIGGHLKRVAQAMDHLKRE